MKKISPKAAFSLVELSIVILIIGVLIAGITQSSRLVGKFRLSTARNLTKSAPVAGIPNLVTWWETTSSESLLDAEAADGLTVSRWTDINPQSQVRHIATQSTNASKPIYSENMINGLPALMFTRTSDTVGTYLARPYDSSVNPAQFTAFVVVKTKSAVSPGAIFSSRNLSGSFSGYALYAINGTPSYQLWLHNNLSLGDNSPLNSAIAINSAEILSMSYNGTNMNFYENGTSAGGPQARPFTTSSTSEFRIGVGSGGDGGSASSVAWPYDGYIGEIILYDRALMSDERKDVEKYLSKKWAIKVS